MSNDGFWSTLWRIVRVSRAVTIAIVLGVSLAANATLFVGGVVYDVVDTFIERVTGLQTASALHRQAVTNLQKQNRQLRGQVQTLRSTNRQLRGRVQTVQSANRQLRGQAQTVRSAVPSTVKQTRARLLDSAKRSVTTLPGKALPIAGAAVSVAMTGLLLKDLCATLEDLDRIERAAGPVEGEDDTRTQVCSMSVPAEEEVWAMIAGSPEKVWEASKGFASDLNDLPNARELADKLQEEWRSLLRLLE